MAFKEIYSRAKMPFAGVKNKRSKWTGNFRHWKVRERDSVKSSIDSSRVQISREVDPQENCWRPSSLPNPFQWPAFSESKVSNQNFRQLCPPLSTDPKRTTSRSVATWSFDGIVASSPCSSYAFGQRAQQQGRERGHVETFQQEYRQLLLN